MIPYKPITVSLSDPIGSLRKNEFRIRLQIVNLPSLFAEKIRSPFATLQHKVVATVTYLFFVAFT